MCIVTAVSLNAIPGTGDSNLFDNYKFALV